MLITPKEAQEALELLGQEHQDWVFLAVTAERLLLAAINLLALWAVHLL